MTEENDQAKDNRSNEISTENETGLNESYDIGIILDIPLDVSVELGKTTMLINDLLQLGQGSVVELTKPVGETLDMYVNNKLIAKGEVVVLDDKFGIRVADIINPSERVKSLG